MSALSMRSHRRRAWCISLVISIAAVCAVVVECCRGRGVLDAFVGARSPALRGLATFDRVARPFAGRETFSRDPRVAANIFGQGVAQTTGLPFVFSELEGASADSAMRTVKRWLAYLKGTGSDRLGALSSFADASGYPLEQALELFLKDLAFGASTVVTMKLPDGVSDALGEVGWVAAVRDGEDLDLSLFGEGEWETIHVDFMATNPLMGWASEVKSGDLQKRLQVVSDSGRQLLQSLLDSAARAGRAVTVAPLDEQLKEHYRQLGFKEDALLDPTLMFWVPTGEARLRLAYAN